MKLPTPGTKESMPQSSFQLGREVGQRGRFVRQESRFRDRVTADGSSGFPAEHGRYHLYVALACPWSHRTVITRKLKGLEDAIGISYLDPYRDERGWAFSGDRFTDGVNDFRFLCEAYERTEPGFDGRVSVPVLWDRETGQIVSNESGDLMVMLDQEFDELAESDVELHPDDLRAEIDDLGEWIYGSVNNAVYEAGFAGSQEAYEDAFNKLFGALDLLEQRLSDQRYLTGDRITAVDWRLWVTLVRFDSVYNLHFRCNWRRIVDYPSLWGFTRDLYQQPGIAETVAMDEIKRHYYTTHDTLNPKRIIPAGPELDFWALPERDG